MKAVFSLIAMIFTSGVLLAQNTVEQAGVSSSSPFAEHISQFSWLYIVALIVLIGVFAAVYYFGLDKKLFRTNANDDGPQLFI